MRGTECYRPAAYAASVNLLWLQGGSASSTEALGLTMKSNTCRADEMIE
jgi:hypothetical protein